ncbi:MULTISPECIES: barstar family protein [Bacillus]|uniref:barstar family protein n=1 Tax=Bacillus TaxID=1386 RepID=UPI000B42D58D|nr:MULTISPECIES: barstar family protein [Bacillus cereus group]MBH0344983.1 barnase inhibitor [Bacillus thuringiensis]MCQ6521122.1 barstar family protein [Bacillus paranthracis]MCU5232052.1 barstar family protein [Bacillus paranthracis]MDA1909494.1 barstar family protein [Bacillus cereus]MDQ7236626.1 barstar family protein [Bacillus pacificus]
MEIVKLDGRKFTSKEVLHQTLKKQLDFPSFYGENADALWDCLTGFIGLPITIEWEFFKSTQKMLGPYADLILKIFQDAQNEMPGKFYIVVK